MEDDKDIHAFGSTSLHSGRKAQTDGKWGNSYGMIDISGTHSYAYVSKSNMSSSFIMHQNLENGNRKSEMERIPRDSGLNFPFASSVLVSGREQLLL